MQIVVEVAVVEHALVEVALLVETAWFDHSCALADEQGSVLMKEQVVHDLHYSLETVVFAEDLPRAHR